MAEIINKEKGCATENCPGCRRPRTSYRIENGVFQWWCTDCKIAFEGEIVVDWDEFANDPRYNEV